MATMVFSLQSNIKAWEADRPSIVEKCTQCRTCYPDRYLEHADLVNGICVTCRAPQG